MDREDRVAIARQLLGSAPARMPELATFALGLVQGQGDLMRVRELLPPEFTPGHQVIKAALGGGSIADPNWAASLAPYAQMSQTFHESLRPISPYDRSLPDMRLTPMFSRLAVATTGATGSKDAPGVARALSKMVLANDDLAPIYATAIVVLTAEVLKMSNPAAVAMIDRELRGAVATTVNTAFLATITSGAPTTACTGATATTAVADIASLLTQIEIGDTSRLYLIVPSAALARIAVKLQAQGFRDINVTGGFFCGITVLPSDGCPSVVAGSPSIARPTAVLYDADGLATDSLVTVLSTSEHAALQFDNAPTNRSTLSGSPQVPTATNLVSLFQTSAAAIKAQRVFGVTRIRTSVAWLTNLQW